MEPLLILGFLFAVFCGLAGLIVGINEGTWQLMARQNVRLPILTIERVAPFFWVSLGLREADAFRVSGVEDFEGITVEDGDNGAWEVRKGKIRQKQQEDK